MKHATPAIVAICACAGIAGCSSPTMAPAAVDDEHGEAAAFAESITVGDATYVNRAEHPEAAIGLTDASPCTADAGLLSRYVASTEAGAAAWDCDKVGCTPQIAVCTADPCCNGAVLKALACQESAPTPARRAACLANTAQSSDPAVIDIVACLSGPPACE